MQIKTSALCFLLLPALLLFSSEASAARNKGNAAQPAKPAAGPGESDCKTSMEPFFAIRQGDTVVSKASFTTQHEIVFYPSQTWADRLEWDFGDGQTFVQTKLSGFANVPHAYSSFGTYPVTLTAVKACKESEPRKDVFAQEVTIFDPNLLTCTSTTKITENDIKMYRIDALAYWIKTMRRDIAREKGVTQAWESMARELAGVKKYKGSSRGKL